MSDIELNKALHEWMGECWHEPDDEETPVRCKKCGYQNHDTPVRVYHKSYTTNPAHFWRLLQKVKEKNSEKFYTYCLSLWINAKDKPLDSQARYMFELFSDMPRGCEAIADLFIPDWRTK